MRKRHKALSAHAEFVPLYAVENEYPFIYARAADEEVRRGDRPVCGGAV